MAAFSRARAPGIYKEDYLKELFRRYGDEEEAPAPPALPEWCFDGDDDIDDDGNDVGQESVPGSSGSALGKRKREKLKLVRLAEAPSRGEMWVAE